MALAMLTTGACRQIDNAVTERDLECGALADDICARLARYAAADWLRLNASFGPIVKVVVSQQDCDAADDPAIKGCWLVEATTAQGAGGGELITEREDGTFVNSDGKVIVDGPAE
jgi:hypothetical protein